MKPNFLGKINLGGRQKSNFNDQEKKRLIDVISRNEFELLLSFPNLSQYINISSFYISSHKFNDLGLSNARYLNHLPLHQLPLLHIAAIFDSLECFFILVENFGADISIRSANSYLPIHYSALFGSKEVLLYILTKSPDQANYEISFSFFHFEFFSIFYKFGLLFISLFTII
ncbi:hypothetical protein TRFO_24426 [Tritrichomonas foetus]|uniref:Uncharacterized protein n=1 Tax=Tritrichomonas foetus TaxID=1144522 RepID=A0A1J4KCN0_9EUKA|nr:hypothetical protein TRFO_24426 [Tritrichomonas foetus]|eukprot:OHT07406.1 hypothetical protein TRFO_24426 [Tritrichomonas foetus]